MKAATAATDARDSPPSPQAAASGSPPSGNASTPAPRTTQLATKPQCQIVPLAYSGQIAVSPGCAISRARTGLPAGELTCALPAGSLPAIIDRLRQAVTADQAAVAYATKDLAYE